MKAVQIGAGLVGSIIAADMGRSFDVTVVDLNENTLSSIREDHPEITTAVCSCTDSVCLSQLVRDADIVTAGVPGKFGRKMMEIVIKSGKNMADISFMPEDFEELDGLAKEHGVTVVPDMGVAPGMSNFLIEEYTRPARYVKDHRPVVCEAMGELYEKEFPKAGLLETFITDGLRSLIKNIKAKNMEERTMRWPGHVAQMRLLREMGLFDEEKRNLGGVEVIPRDIACDLLFPMWKMEPKKGDRDLTIMQVEVSGYKGRDFVTYTWDLWDIFDEKSWKNSMGRCTGFSCSIFAQAIVKGLIKEKGVIAPEKLAASDELYDFVMAEQRSRGINYEESVKIQKNKR